MNIGRLSGLLAVALLSSSDAGVRLRGTRTGEHEHSAQRDDMVTPKYSLDASLGQGAAGSVSVSTVEVEDMLGRQALTRDVGQPRLLEVNTSDREQYTSSKQSNISGGCPAGREPFGLRQGLRRRLYDYDRFGRRCPAIRPTRPLW
jgi:hypothetical protein